VSVFPFAASWVGVGRPNNDLYMLNCDPRSVYTNVGDLLAICFLYRTAVGWLAVDIVTGKAGRQRGGRRARCSTGKPRAL